MELEYVQRVYLPTALAPDVLERNARSVSAQLRSLRLMVGDQPSWGGLIACGRDPQFWVPGAYIQFVRFAGTDLTSPVANQKELRGRLDDVLRWLDGLILRSEPILRPAPARPGIPTILLKRYIN